MLERSFELYNHPEKKIFFGNRPRQAASSIFSFIMKKYYKKNSEHTVKFAIIECARDKKNRIYFYKGVRSKLIEPLHIMTNSKKLLYSHTNSIMVWVPDKSENIDNPNAHLTLTPNKQSEKDKVDEVNNVLIDEINTNSSEKMEIDIEIDIEI